MTSSQGKEIDLEQQIDFLKKINFFHDFDDHELRQFMAVSRWLKVPKGTQIIKEGTTERVFYILVKGRVSVFKTLDSGGIIELTTLATGDCFGEMALVSETKRTAGVKTTKDSFILMVDPAIISTSNVFLQLKFYKRFCEILVTRLVMANQKMAGQGKPPEAPAAKAADRTPPAAAEAVTEEEPKKRRKKTNLAALPPMPEKKSRIPQSRIERLIAPDLKLPVNPAVVKAIEGLLVGECEDTRRLADLISLEPVLSSKVLQAANSPFFRRAAPVASVPHAMIIVGIKHIQQVVSEAIEASRYVKAFGGFAEVGRTYWEHAVVVGRIAELLRDVIRVNMATDVYLAGLLHDLGMLPLDALEPAFYPQLLRPNSELAGNIGRAEIEFIGADHGLAGRCLGEQLGLPLPLLDVMRLHHQPEQASGEHALPIALVNLANIFAAQRGVCLGGQAAATTTPLDSFAWILIQEHHRPFTEVNLFDFIKSFEEELAKAWEEITANIPLP